MKQIFRNSTHQRHLSHDCLVAEISGKKVKITYEAGNAYERCTTEIFDGVKWNHIYDILNMGEMPNKTAYIQAPEKRGERADDLFDTAVTMCKAIL